MPYAPLRRTIMPLGRAFAGATPWWLSGGISASNCIAAYAPKGAASQAASYSNLNSPGTHDLTVGTAPAWDATNGWKGGSNAYLKTDITPSGAAATWSAIIRFSNGGNGYEWLFGAYSGGFGVVLSNYVTKISAYNWNYKDHSGAVTSGTVCIAGGAWYVNNVVEATTLSGGTAPTCPVYILCFNNNGSPSSYTTSYIQALAIYNTAITSGQASALHTAIMAL